MTPNSLYSLTPIRIETDINAIIAAHHQHLLLIIADYDDLELDSILPRVEAHYYADPYIDGYRVWTLAALKFDGDFCVITQSAGRAGKDHNAHFVTGALTYEAMCNYLNSKIVSHINVKEIDADTQSDKLCCFCGDSFDASTLKPLPLTFEQFIDKYGTELEIYAAESGADRELGYSSDVYTECAFDRYLAQTEAGHVNLNVSNFA